MSRRSDSERILDHIHKLSDPGARPSCSAAERRAAIYALSILKKLGVERVGLEEFNGHPSTYQPYILAFLVALVGAGLAWFFADWLVFVPVVMGAMLGAGGMLLETNLDSSWMRKLLPRRTAQNVVGVMPPKKDVKNRAVLCAHLDTHRTPVFFSSPAWGRVFSLLVSGAFVSMLLSILIGFLGLLGNWMVLRWVMFLPMLIELLAMLLCVQAEFTPFTPGANDNASGVGVCLALAEELSSSPLQYIEVWLAFTDAEETGCDGMKRFLHDHAAELGDNAVYIILDEVGLGQLTWLTADGLILKHPTHPKAVELVCEAKSNLPGLSLGTKVGQAFTDALVATKADRIALTLVAVSEDPSQPGHLHQMSDTVEHVDPRALQDAISFTRQLLSVIDGQVIIAE